MGRLEREVMSLVNSVRFGKTVNHIKRIENSGQIKYLGPAERAACAGGGGN